MIHFEDQLGRIVSLPQAPKRIVSLCPSITETLFSLLPASHIVGRTRFCIHPQPAVKSVSRIGGTKDVNLDRVKALAPDLIIAEKEENIQGQVEALAAHYPVCVTDVTDIPSAIEMIQLLGKVCDAEASASGLVQRVEAAFQQKPQMASKVPPRVAYLIWRDPYMIAGGNTYIQDLLRWSGCENVGVSMEGRYPVATTEQLQSLNPSHIWLSSEPFPFQQKHLLEMKKLLPHAHVQLVDGEMFSWYGTRMEQAPAYIRNLLKRA